MAKRKNDLIEGVYLRKSRRQENLLQIKNAIVQVNTSAISQSLPVKEGNIKSRNLKVNQKEKTTLTETVADIKKEYNIKNNLMPNASVITRKMKYNKENIEDSSNIKQDFTKIILPTVPRVIERKMRNRNAEISHIDTDVIIKKDDIKQEIIPYKLKGRKTKDIIELQPNKSLHDILVPVDKECITKLETAIVFVDGDDIYDIMLNQTNLQFNNNKFYVIQLLKDKNEEYYSVWMRWARVGRVGQTKLSFFGDDLQKAKDCFCKKFFDKTKNDWENRSHFEKVNGKYDLVQIDYLKSENLENIEVMEDNKVKLETIECKLEDKIQDLLRIIFDIKEMNSTASSMNYDSNRLPLGRLTEAQIKAGYKALREIEGLLNEGYSSNHKLLIACNAYYTRIPHDFGMRVPPMIRSLVDIKRELELLETLSDIKIALNLLKMGDNNVHPLERQYQSLDCFIKPVCPQEDSYQLVNDYLLKTHGDTHKEYSLEMLDLYELRKDNEWNNFEDFGNKMLLWHGSRTTNYGGILSQGLRIAPAEAPITGHMFGKGVYFSDISSKSANYVYPSRSKNVGFMLLCEVSLGNCNNLTKANSRAGKLPKDMHSVKGSGMMEPEPSCWVTITDNVLVPIGSPRDSKLSEKQKGYLLNYNEYIVYNRNQIKMRYLLKVRFNYK